MAIDPVDLATLTNLLGLPEGATVALSGSVVSAGVSDTSLANFAGSSENPFLILSSGIVSQVTLPNIDGSQGVDLGLEGISGDSVTLTFTLPRPVGARAFSFDFTFLSEEPPEFVGTEFDDFLSIKINGVEAAVDPNGNRITVNNNFFSDPYEPEGTIFDKQIPPLSIIAPLADELDTVTLSIQVADVGDGLYDSAAFLSNFRFVQPQSVYLQFDEGEVDFPSFLDETGFRLPGSGLTVAEQDQIIAALESIYDGFLVEFTRTRPLSGEYSTVHVGGAAANLPSYLADTTGLLGRAEKIDYGNRDKSDAAFVLSGEIAQPNLALLSQVIAHEVGHILGLRHVAGDQDLLRPFADPANTIIGGLSELAEIDPDTNQIILVGGVQNSRAELGKGLGLTDSTQVAITESVADQTLKLFSFDARGGTNPLFRPKIVIANAENEVLSYVEVGTVPANGLIEVLLPATDRDKVVLIAQSSETSGYDIFASPGDVETFDVDDSSEQSVLNAFGVEVDDLNSSALELVKVGADGELTTLGPITAFELDASDLAATEGDDVLVGEQRVADNLIGLGGDDRLSGLGGPDRLFGNSGDDLLDGGGGDDYLSGGEGVDTFYYGSDARGLDSIIDFSEEDFLVTTTRLVDKNGDGIIDFGKNRALDMVLQTGAEVTSQSGASIQRLEFDGTFVKGEAVYYVYSLVGSTTDPELALANL